MNMHQKRIIVREQKAKEPTLEPVKTPEENITLDQNTTHKSTNTPKLKNTKESNFIFKELADVNYDQLTSTGFTFEMDAEIRQKFDILLHEYSKRQSNPDILIKNQNLRMGEIFDYMFIRFCEKLKLGNMTEKDFHHFITITKPKRVIKRNFRVRCKDYLDEFMNLLSEKTGTKLVRKDCVMGMMKYILAHGSLDF